MSMNVATLAHNTALRLRLLEVQSVFIFLATLLFHRGTARAGPGWRGAL